MLDAIWFCGAAFSVASFHFFHEFHQSHPPFLFMLFCYCCLRMSDLLDALCNSKMSGNKMGTNLKRKKWNKVNTNFSSHSVHIRVFPFIVRLSCTSVVYECVIGLSISNEFHIMSRKLWLVFIFIVHCRKWYPKVFLLSSTFTQKMKSKKNTNNKNFSFCFSIFLLLLLVLLFSFFIIIDPWCYIRWCKHFALLAVSLLFSSFGFVVSTLLWWICCGACFLAFTVAIILWILFFVWNEVALAIYNFFLA